LNFQNPSWRTAAILKTVKSPYLLNRLTDLDEIRHSDANQDGGNRHLENLKKSRYLLNSLTDLYEIWHDYAKLVS